METTEAKERKSRTITLTDRAPVKIWDDEWPIIAEASNHDGQVESQANRRKWIKVREHADGRRIVYGRYSTQFQHERDAAGGALTDAAGTVAAIRAVADEVIDDAQLGDECIADLPAEEI